MIARVGKVMPTAKSRGLWTPSIVIPELSQIDGYQEHHTESADSVGDGDHLLESMDTAASCWRSGEYLVVALPQAVLRTLI
jgi:hypothetical protein